MTASIGVAVAIGMEHKSEDVLAQPDITMYGIKRAGRNRVSVVELGRNEHTATFAMASELHGALEREELHLGYQHVFAASDRRLVGFEALWRWDHAKLGRVIIAAQYRHEDPQPSTPQEIAILRLAWEDVAA
jgi:predicted signal transduction protein with EAL and GGDEF domain